RIAATPTAPTVVVTDTSQLAEVPPESSGNPGSVNLSVTDPNPSDTVTLTASPSWISLTDAGSGQYTLATIARTPTAGSYTITVTATDDTGRSGTDTFVVDVCSFDDCGDFLQSLDGTVPTVTDFTSSGFKVSGQDHSFISLTGDVYNRLFGSGRPTGTFEQTWQPTISSAYGGGDPNDEITGQIVVDFDAETAVVVIQGDLNNLTSGSYAKGDLTFSDSHTGIDIPADGIGGKLFLEQILESQNSGEGGPFSYQYQIGLGEDGSGGLGFSGRVEIRDNPTFSAGQPINTEGAQILEPQ
ncbi:hypothetical protein N9Y18_03390, partial [Litoricolaceae bacterium]|nr:hypothetical protein [Litorivicinaceae bacterium]